MRIDSDSQRPIFEQVAEGICDAILSGAFPEEGRIPSTTELSVSCRINPATALKGITQLADEGIIYKKRGLGMFVSPGAADKLRRQRRERFFRDYVLPLTAEAKRLSIDSREAAEIVKRGFEE